MALRPALLHPLPANPVQSAFDGPLDDPQPFGDFFVGVTFELEPRDLPAGSSVVEHGQQFLAMLGHCSGNSGVGSAPTICSMPAMSESAPPLMNTDSPRTLPPPRFWAWCRSSWLIALWAVILTSSGQRSVRSAQIGEPPALGAAEEAVQSAENHVLFVFDSLRRSATVCAQADEAVEVVVPQLLLGRTCVVSRLELADPMRN